MSEIQKTIYLRKEMNNREYRTPITPHYVEILISYNYIVYIESSLTRIYCDEDFLKAGAIITKLKWYDSTFKNALIIGIKEIEELNKLDHHCHLYFSHSYKNQYFSKQILSAFEKSNSIIYDFEFFLDKKNKRIISFCFYAGVVGGILGLLQYIEKTYFKENITDLKVWKDRKQVVYYLKIFKRNHLLDKVKIVIIGGNGTCGTGVIDVLDDLDLKYTILGSKDEKKELKEYDIIFNCIRLNDNSKEIWFDKETEITKPLIISDISCDYTRENHPIKIYDKATTWEKPVFNYNEYVDIIAIDNLPSLLPKESSDVFSKKCVELLTTLDDEPWEKCEQIFFTEIYNKI